MTPAESSLADAQAREAVFAELVKSGDMRKVPGGYDITAQGEQRVAAMGKGPAGPGRALALPPTPAPPALTADELRQIEEALRWGTRRAGGRVRRDAALALLRKARGGA
jgi:hypothetical protein